MILYRFFGWCDGFVVCQQKRAYEMRISDWSSDVCSSDLEVDSRVSSLTAVLPLRPSGGRDVSSLPYRGVFGSKRDERSRKVGASRRRYVPTQRPSATFEPPSVDAYASRAAAFSTASRPVPPFAPAEESDERELGRASWRDRGCQSV